MNWNVRRLILPKVQNYWHRQGWVKYFFSAIFIVFSYQVLQIAKPDAQGVSVADRARVQAQNVQTKRATRGDILDRHGAILASNLRLKRVNLDPTRIQVEFIPKLAAALRMDAQKLSRLLMRKRLAGKRYLIIKKNLRLTDPIIQNLTALKRLRLRVCRDVVRMQKLSFADKALNLIGWQSVRPTQHSVHKCGKQRLGGVALQQDTRRYYPKAAAFAPLIGRVNADKRGASGLEREFEHILSGTHGKTVLDFEHGDGAYFKPSVLVVLAHGQNLTLTIDAQIQHIAFAAVKQSVDKHEADSGSAIVLARNGEVLALVNYPADDPNDKQIYRAEHYRNRVLSDKVEPGSTMKPFTMLLALEQGKIRATEDELIDVTQRIGHIKPDKKYRQMTVKKILQRSHNLGTVAVSERLDKADMYETWQKLGFGQPLNVMPSIENVGLLRHPYSWSKADKRTLSFGYGPMATNLAQLARAYLVFANEGALPPLSLVRGVDTLIASEQVFKPETVARIAELLAAVVSNKGSGYRAQIKGYSVAGKTGTAEMLVDGHYSKSGAKRTFFVGFVPADNPDYVMAVRLDNPQKCYTAWDITLRDKCEGSTSASMTFQRAMTQILHRDAAANSQEK